MRKSTLILASALVMGGVMTNAQNVTKHKRLTGSMAGVMKSAAEKKDTKNSNDTRKTILRTALKAATEQYLPKQESLYEYDAESGKWLLSGVYQYEYDKNGNELKQTENIDGNITVKETTLSDDELTETEVERASEDNGKTYVNIGKKVQVYDPIAKGLVVEKQRYEWDEAANDWAATTDAFKREITRDEKNNVLTLQILVPYEGKYDATERYTNTVDPETGNIVSYKYETLAYDENFQLTWDTEESITGITWEKTNGQLVSQYDEWMQWGNYLKTAKLTDYEGDEPLDFCNISVDYKGDGGYKEVFEYTDEPELTVTEKTMTDNNGSYTIETKTTYTEDGVETIEDWIKEVLEYDAHGNLTFNEIYFLDESGTALELVAGQKIEYTYDATHGDALKELVESEYDYTTQQYEPAMRVVVDEFVDITAGINRVNSNNAAEIAVYNLQGMRVPSTSLTGKGIYIVKNGDKTVKIMK